MLEKNEEEGGGFAMRNMKEKLAEIESYYLTRSDYYHTGLFILPEIVLAIQFWVSSHEHISGIIVIRPPVKGNRIE
jgi:hypothetical protein